MDSEAPRTMVSPCTELLHAGLASDNSNAAVPRVARGPDLEVIENIFPSDV
jgi:hypothetical protein